MAIFTPAESPGVTVKEIDLTGVVRNQQTTTGAMVCNMRWGPVDQITEVPDEANLASTFGTPDLTTYVDFIGASMFLKYSQDLKIVRVIDSDAVNAYDSDALAAPVIKNRDDFDDQLSALDSDGHTFVAKYPGDLGNSLKVAMCPFDSDGSTYENWAYRNNFDAAPGTSSFASNRNASNDEMHVVVIDKNGKFTGTVGSVLETYPFVSLGRNAKKDDGSTNFVRDVVNNNSRYVYMVGFDSDYTAAGAGTDIDSGADFALTSNIAIKNINMDNGVNAGAISTGQYALGFDLFEDVDDLKSQVDFLVAPQLNDRASLTAVVNDLVSIAQSTRKDCVVVASPCKTDVVNSAAPVTNAVTTVGTFTASSYLFVDNNYLKIYDKYNDRYVWIAANSSTAGIMAASDQNAAPWYSPAGTRRGQYLNVTSLAYSPTRAQRDTLYRAGINPIANIPGYGVLLYGDKTMLGRPSAFDRINVRRLFLVIERAIARAAKNVLFEFNDEFTRAEFVNVVEPFLREIQGRRGITDFRVVCDETNNTPTVVDRNEFVADIYIKPARSINYVNLNFVATRTGARFEEIVGTV